MSGNDERQQINSKFIEGFKDKQYNEEFVNGLYALRTELLNSSPRILQLMYIEMSGPNWLQNEGRSKKFTALLVLQVLREVMDERSVPYE